MEFIPAMQAAGLLAALLSYVIGLASCVPQLSQPELRSQGCFLQPTSCSDGLLLQFYTRLLIRSLLQSGTPSSADSLAAAFVTNWLCLLAAYRLLAPAPLQQALWQSGELDVGIKCGGRA